MFEIENIANKYNKYNFLIFGSRARGDFKYNSDIDIAIRGEITKIDEFNILNEFDLLELPYNIDVVFFNKIERYFWFLFLFIFILQNKDIQEYTGIQAIYVKDNRLVSYITK